MNARLGNTRAVVPVLTNSIDVEAGDELVREKVAQEVAIEELQPLKRLRKTAV